MTKMESTMRPSRPRVNDRAVTDAAAVEMFPAFAEWQDRPLSESEGRNVRDLLRGMIYSDAYEMAREFERAGWDANSELMHVLEGWDFQIRRAHVRAIGEWIAAHGIQARYGLGHLVAVPSKQHLTGVVVRVNEKEGTYTVRIDALGHVREGELGTIGNVYAWEDVESATDSLAGASVPAVD